jgi:uncharacterized RDD family membrane protein YckC
MASAEYSVLTPERVSLKYDIAGVGSRGAAAVVDTVIQAITLIVVLVGLWAATMVAVSPIGFAAPVGSGGAMLILGLLALAIFVVTSGYFMLWEILWNGQTPGKRLVGVRVIRENGYPIRPVDAVVRNLVRIVDWLPSFYGVGILVMLVNKRSRRLGDFASGTIVVRERSPVIPIASVSGQRDYALRNAEVGGPPGYTLRNAEVGGPPRYTLRNADVGGPPGYTLRNADATLVRDFLMRRSVMSPRARAELASRLATAVSQRYGLPLGDDAEAFLERLSL